MKGILSLAYSIAVDKLVNERERRNKVLKVKEEIRYISSIVAKSKINPKYKSRISRKLISFSNDVIHYDTEKLDNVIETLNSLKLGAKVLQYVSSFSEASKIADGLEAIVDRINFAEFVDSEDFEYELISSLDEALEAKDYIVKSFKNKTLLELRNQVKFQKFVYKVVKNFSTVTPRYFLDNKLKEYKFKKKKTEDNTVVLYFSHGKTIGIKYAKKLDFKFEDDVTIYVVPQLNEDEKDLVKNYFSRDGLLFIYSLSEDKLYYNKKDARALYFASYLGNKVPVSSEKILSRVSKRRGVYAAAELGVSEASLPIDFDDEFWR